VILFLKISLQVILNSKSVANWFLQSHPPITEIFRFCLIVYLSNMFQPSTGSSSDTDEINYQNCFLRFAQRIRKFTSFPSKVSYLFRTFEATLLVRALSKSDLVRTATELSGRTLTVFVAAFSVRSVGRSFAIGATSESEIG
jgi:hypothetical protein